MTQDKVLPIASVRCGIIPGLIELQRVETFTGAACCQLIELPSYKAAPLQAVGNKHALSRPGNASSQLLDSSS